MVVHCLPRRGRSTSRGNRPVYVHATWAVQAATCSVLVLLCGTDARRRKLRSKASVSSLHSRCCSVYSSTACAVGSTQEGQMITCDWGCGLVVCDELLDRLDNLRRQQALRLQGVHDEREGECCMDVHTVAVNFFPTRVDAITCSLTRTE